MPQEVNVNGKVIQYPVIGDVEWGAEATDFAVQVAGALAKIGQSTPPVTNDITIGGILNVDSGTLYVNPTNNRVGINDSSPSEALDVTGNVLINGNLLNSDGTVSAPSITFTNDTNTGLYRIGADEIGVTTNGIQRTKIGSYGVYTSGSIVQVASTTKTDTFSTTSLSFIDITGLSVSITPKFTTSRILIIVSVAKGASADDVGGFELRRDSTSIAIADSGGGIRSSMTAYYGGTTITAQLNTLSLTHLDSPSTTSAITYSLRGRQHTAGTLLINRNNSDNWRAVSSITAMELAT